MEEQMFTSDIVDEKEVSQKNQDTTTVTDAPITFNPENISDKKAAATDDTAKYQRLTKRIEHFLVRACEAEASGDYLTAGRNFRLALFVEGRLRSDVENPHIYIFQTMPIYELVKIDRFATSWLHKMFLMTGEKDYANGTTAN